MKLAEITSFRKDLLFHGAVQLGWFERDKLLSEKAAAHFIFHGPNYHGVKADSFTDSSFQLVDTASFTLEAAERLTGKETDEPFIMAIAGYGTGKSHLAVTLAHLFSQPNSSVAEQIVNNIALADKTIGHQVSDSITSLKGQPYLVVTLNGMEDFDLSNEIIRQLFKALKEKNLDTKMLENLRPRFKLAENFAKSFHEVLREDFERYFGAGCQIDQIVNELDLQDEQTFLNVNNIYSDKMGSALPAAGQESLQDFIRVTKDVFCGPGKPFAGIMILFDEFGRYLEFAVQKPHIAGPAALQQLFEAVQENADGVFMLAFIQSELKAYVSRVAPERRDEINRYVTRFDSVRKVRLSTNLETVIANLIEKKQPHIITENLAALDVPLTQVQISMKEWFPEITHHSLWAESESFTKVVGQGCWPLHPLTTWVLYKLSTIGKSLQQRSALSLLSDVFTSLENRVILPGSTIRPTDIFAGGLADEFSASESMGTQGAVTLAYQVVEQKYQNELTFNERTALRAIVIQQKIGIKVKDKNEYIRALSMFCGITSDDIKAGLDQLEKEYGVLEWNELLCQYEIVGDAVPRKTFLNRLRNKTMDINSETRAQLFSKCKEWLRKNEFNTDFGQANDISTKEWGYSIHFTSFIFLQNQIQFALREWQDANNVDTSKGQLIYYYVGPESDLSTIQAGATNVLNKEMESLNIDPSKGAPLAISFLYDDTGNFGQSLAEYWVLEQGLSTEEQNKFTNFILDKKKSTLQELEFLFQEMEIKRHVVVASALKISPNRLKIMLEQLFDVVYPQRISFPFDGFSTARGNAAKDCQTFTKELILGNLDREWLQARNQKQTNRGYTVLDRAWGIFDTDGSVRLLPTDKAVREAITVIDSRLYAKEEHIESLSINVGEVLRIWMSPPFGLNLASAGLLLAVFISPRLEELEFVLNDNTIGIEIWLAQAMPSNFFDLSVLDNTLLIRVSEVKVSEWVSLLEKWDLENSYLGQIQFLEQANELSKRVPVPPKLAFKYQFYQDRTNTARVKINKFEKDLTDALEKIEAGRRKDDVNLLSWGASILARQYNEMDRNENCWTKEQIDEVKEHYIAARLLASQLFPRWINSQMVTNIEHLRDFKRLMLGRIGNNLDEIGLNGEREQLEKHVAEVETNLRLLDELKRSVEDVKKLVENNVVSETSKVVDLQEWQEQVKTLNDHLHAANKRTHIGKRDIVEAALKLRQFSSACEEQLQKQRDKAGNIFDHRSIITIADITKWKTEVFDLIGIYAGMEKDVEDFKQVIRQLEQVENHYTQLNDTTLTEPDLAETLDRCRRELADLFVDDQPPLDSELIYHDIMISASQQRSQLATSWMNRMMEKIIVVPFDDVTVVLQTKKQLDNMPAVLTEEQREKVLTGIKICEKRLDDLEADGLIAKFVGMPESTKKTFLSKLIAHLEKKFPSAKIQNPYSSS